MQNSQTEEENNMVESILYVSEVEIIIYYMICSRADLDYAFSIISRFMVNLVQVYWEPLKLY